MKICHVCGCEVDDRELICPDCGATVVKHSGMLSLKSQEENKKKLNPMGMTVSTGSGLTDILRNESEFDSADIDDDFYGGSMPVGLGKTIIEDDGKKKSDTGKVLAKVFKIVFVVALLVGAYWLVTNVILKRENVESYNDAIDIYVEAINMEDSEKMEKIIPSYLNDQSKPAKDIVEGMKEVTIDKYDIIETTDLSEDEITGLQDDIKIVTTKTAKIDEAVKVRIRFYGSTKNSAGQDVKLNTESELIFIKVKDNWLLETESYMAPEID